ncbi:MAG: TonB family protein [Candidatus Omnitrophica bacterium]|nr:TonB family protein [Candidatus Omnitrophota bacterium]
MIKKRKDMPSDRNFQLALVFSLLAHTAMVINYPGFNLLPFAKKPLMVKISYLKNPPQLTETQKQMLSRKAHQVKLPSQVSAFDKNSLIPPSNKEILKLNRPALPHQQALIKPAIIKPDIIAVKKKITLPPVDMEKMNNPTYVSYYQFVREKIRRAAYQNFSRSETGEVYMAFVISSTGILRDVRLIEEKSSPNYYLRETALRSIRDASPFPLFPKELDYPQLSFNVIISFEIE